MNITPVAPAGRQIIKSYGSGGFKVSEETYASSVLVFPEYTVLWPVKDIVAITIPTLNPVFEEQPPVEVLLVGCGERMAMLPPDVTSACRENGIGIDAMDTGAACRTFNVLISEERRVAAALLALA